MRRGKTRARYRYFLMWVGVDSGGKVRLMWSLGVVSDWWTCLISYVPCNEVSYSSCVFTFFGSLIHTVSSMLVIVLSFLF